VVYRRYYGPGGDPSILVVQAAAREFNPTLPQSVVDRALERDQAAASAEYLAQFRSDIESFVSREAVEVCVDVGVRERMPTERTKFFGFTDPSGGSGDSFALAIGHHERRGDLAVLDAVREVRPPFSPKDCVEEFARLLKSYRVTRVVGDRYAGEWPREQLRKHGISYEVGTKVKSDIYRDALPMINSGRIRLLDHQRLIGQLCSLERRTSRGGRDSIDHPPDAHDDVANSVCGPFGRAERSGARRRLCLVEMGHRRHRARAGSHNFHTTALATPVFWLAVTSGTTTPSSGSRLTRGRIVNTRTNFAASGAWLASAAIGFSVYRLTWRLPLAGLVALNHLQFSQIRGHQPYSIDRGRDAHY
jgi:hypothetical protein